MSINDSLKVTTGEAPFDVPAAGGKQCKTWYKVYGDLNAGKRPLVTLHGGPGVNHEYLTPLSDITASHSIPVVFYDQIGNGLSTHLPEKMGDEAFWTVQLFIDELNNLLQHLGIADDFDLLGHSWGGIFAASYAITQPKGLKHLIIASGPADMPATVISQEKLRSQLPQDVQDTLTKHEEAGTTESDEYKTASDVFNARYVCRMDPMPQELVNGFAWIAKDPTVYMTMNGPSEFKIQGSLKNYSVVDQIHKINVPTLLTNGRYDEVTEELVAPFFDILPKVKWVVFADSSHLAHFEERERYMATVTSFLTN
ncbi:L-amino acid amidase [Psilocybe cubensis]|uniref:AB hydrolase-1 domain-containing protein n=2 Tax=Psilocybe cubensis TaxID=181762 RepID=A0A8H7XZR3_PSICU|nr:L-amino acid amidase [Psilocybe cubensis]KAH9478777.1 L-amino acid amidase [Psilocybe cubensis]